jgi:hypothetical protein
MPMPRRLARYLHRREPIIVVSGLPRSGTSMAMSMLEAGGVPLLTDGVRRPDEHNPRGYHELEAVKQLDKGGDTSWLGDAGGKAVKIVTFLLTWLPETYDYCVILMERDLEEVIASQNRMLGQSGSSEDRADAQTRSFYERHLQQTRTFLSRRRCFSTLSLNYRETVEQPRGAASQLQDFLDRALDVDAMAAIADPALHRNRASTP